MEPQLDWPTEKAKSAEVIYRRFNQQFGQDLSNSDYKNFPTSQVSLMAEWFPVLLALNDNSNAANATLESLNHYLNFIVTNQDLEHARSVIMGLRQAALRTPVKKRYSPNYWDDIGKRWTTDASQPMTTQVAHMGCDVSEIIYRYDGDPRATNILTMLKNKLQVLSQSDSNSVEVFAFIKGIRASVLVNLDLPDIEEFLQQIGKPIDHTRYD